MKAERERRAAVLEADGEKQAAILRAEGNKQAAILQAEGRKEAAFRDAEARERSAEAEAKATSVVSAAISGGNTASLNYFIGLKYVEAFHALATVAPNQKFVVLPMETAGVLGSLAGIGELTREVFGKGPQPSPPKGGGNVPATAPAQYRPSPESRAEGGWHGPTPSVVCRCAPVALVRAGRRSRQHRDREHDLLFPVARDCRGLVGLLLYAFPALGPNSQSCCSP